MTNKELENKILELEKKLELISSSQDHAFKGSLDDVQVERVLFSDITTGTPPAVGVTGEYPDNNLLYQQALTGLAQDIKILNFPEKVMIYTWKGQRLAIPVYDASLIVYP